MFDLSSTFTWIAGFAILSAIVNGLGILAIFRYRTWAEKAKTYFMCFAAGILVSVPLTLALPNAIQKNFYAGFTALIGFLFMFFSNRLIKRHTKARELAFGVTAAEGIGIHSFIDGIVYTVTFQASILVGILAGTGMVVHEFAEGVITYLVLIRGGAKRKLSMLYAFMIAGLTTPIGAFIVYPLVSGVKDVELGLLLGFAAGVLLYLSSSHLLPEAREQEKEHSSIAFLAGVGLALFIVATKLF
ncbi:MAG: ZIP family metal transporter [Candidatus Korarchaeota archaeon]|nr:ZIP family metal transporter [Candidatus Korarchaeota archaeon]NIU82229.1 ZIP family metal transporter [Candidatus Thorarchaeota archaeon]NIW12692.1 ZIP family metal transporter [Candidatus Thorarchaeota archaeon]NIW50899.1 ZIP family metal transporter [Candidatus Korarchaeota archaeon]